MKTKAAIEYLYRTEAGIYVWCQLNKGCLRKKRTTGIEITQQKSNSNLGIIIVWGDSDKEVKLDGRKECCKTEALTKGKLIDDLKD